MKEALVKVKRIEVQHGKPTINFYWVKPNEVKKTDEVVVSATTEYHINKLNYEGDD